MQFAIIKNSMTHSNAGCDVIAIQRRRIGLESVNNPQERGPYVNFFLRLAARVAWRNERPGADLDVELRGREDLEVIF